MPRKPKPEKLPPAKSTPNKFTPETRAKILSAIERGCFRFQAAALAGINRRTLRDWEILAEKDAESEYAVFVEELERVQFASEARLQVIHEALSTGRKLPDDVVGELTGALADFRQRAMLPALQAQLKYGGSRPWAEIQKFEHSGPNGAPIRIEGPATPEAAAALTREIFGGHARKALEDEEPAPVEKPEPT